MKVKTITIERLYNLGNYEHIRYGLTVTVLKGRASKTLVGMERLLEALNPKPCVKSRTELRNDGLHIEKLKDDLKNLSEEQFAQRHGYFNGSAQEYVKRCQQSHKDETKKRAAWEKRSAKARKLLDDINGAAAWKDAKLDWETLENFE